MIKDKILTLLLILLCGILAQGQTSEIFGTAPNYSKSDYKLDLLYIYDGIPIFKTKQIRKLVIDETTIDTLFFKKGTILNCNLKPAYSATIVILTKDSINPGLKRILALTDSWILQHPLAKLSINGKKTSWNKARKSKLRDIRPALIENIELVEPNLDKSHCNNGLMKLTLKR